MKDEWPKRCETKERRRRRRKTKAKISGGGKKGNEGEESKEKEVLQGVGEGVSFGRARPSAQQRKREREDFTNRATLPSFTENPPQLSPSQHARTTRCSKMAAQLARRSPGASLDHALHSPNSTAFHGPIQLPQPVPRAPQGRTPLYSFKKSLRSDRFFPEITQSRHLSHFGFS